MYSFKEILAQVIAHKRLFVWAQILALLATLASVPTPLLMPLLVDEVLLGKSGTLTHLIDTLFGPGSPLFYVMVVLVATLFLRLLYTALTIAQTRAFQIISKEITFSIRKRVLEHLQRVSLAQYELLGSGNVAARLITDVDTIDTFLSASVSKFLISILSLVGVALVLLLIHWKLALFILLLNPVVVVFSTKLARKVAKLKKEQNRAIEMFQSALTETLELFEQIRATNKESYFFGELFGVLRAVKDRSTQFAWKSDAAVRLSFLVFVAGFELFRAAGILTVAYSDLSIGLMMAIFGYLWFMMTPVQELINIIHTKRSAEVALQRINDLLALQPEPRYPHIHNPFASKEPVSIEVRDLSFAYGEKVVLESVNMLIPERKITAIVGASGSGKSTLGRLLVGFYPPMEGEIFYNHISIKEIGLDVVREHVALVLQTPLLFNDTVRFNLTLGKEIPDDRIMEALKMALLDEKVASMPEGLDTLVGRNGVRLSGGERQRLAIARMILQDPKVVILDESTSALDLDTERLLFCRLERFLKERTTILIAHRPSTIEKADILYRVKESRVEGPVSFDEYKRKWCIL